MGLEETACFSGYRAEKLPFSVRDENQEYDKFLWSLSSVIRKSAEKGYRIFYTGGCTGFDILAGEMLLGMKEEFPEIQLIAVCLLKSRRIPGVNSGGRNILLFWSTVTT